MDLETKKRGRKQGSQNKITLNLKQRLNLFIERNFEGLQEQYDLLEAKDKLSFTVALLPYLIPKLSAVAASVEIETKLQSLNESQLNDMINLILEQNDDTAE
ncbi:hypothetical protein ADIARSV_0149 [Arcticibacter svalbardensis MN12-7]|uniref:Uncharacterized protein n=1 Tax=Arcticibacter svalbardensis MN12-7 TaxID=1150600 RepID=R9GYB2_9SPHI|nr:hypothetical protein [Arcticibacter svalbardensis]EOR96726.1 hypothetical protein ADIARSV_0149 [Arcticibacter svalbardensis MN12-7]